MMSNCLESSIGHVIANHDSRCTARGYRDMVFVNDTQMMEPFGRLVNKCKGIYQCCSDNKCNQLFAIHDIV